MKAEIRVYSQQAEFYTSEGCFIRELSNIPSDPELSIAQARVAKGVTTEWHSLAGTVERYVILAGQGRVEVGDLVPREVGPGDVVIIPPSVRQRITCTGMGDLLFLALCTPRFRPENYERLKNDPSSSVTLSDKRSHE
ncbi:MAG: cupin domain-containing protein [Burkholderiaceae bacterium]|jgi:mannose-6-phosphate isomerase-like protein (cupin superfamily)